MLIDILTNFNIADHFVYRYFNILRFLGYLMHFIPESMSRTGYFFSLRSSPSKILLQKNNSVLQDVFIFFFFSLSL